MWITGKAIVKKVKKTWWRRSGEGRNLSPAQHAFPKSCKHIKHLHLFTFRFSFTLLICHDADNTGEWDWRASETDEERNIERRYYALLHSITSPSRVIYNKKPGWITQPTHRVSHSRMYLWICMVVMLRLIQYKLIKMNGARYLGERLKFAADAYKSISCLKYSCQ